MLLIHHVVSGLPSLVLDPTKSSSEVRAELFIVKRAYISQQCMHRLWEMYLLMGSGNSGDSGDKGLREKEGWKYSK